MSNQIVEIWFYAADILHAIIFNTSDIMVIEKRSPVHVLFQTHSVSPGKVALISCWPPGLIKHRTSERCDGTVSPFGAKTTINRPPWDLILGFVHWGRFHLCSQRTISSPFKWHQTGGTLFRAYKWASVQVCHLTDRQSQIADRPRTEWFILRFYSPFKWMASLISLRPDGFKSPLLRKT